jgi:hypothetical protein
MPAYLPPCVSLPAAGIDIKPIVAAPLDLLAEQGSHADEAPVLYEASSCEWASEWQGWQELSWSWAWLVSIVP